MILLFPDYQWNYLHFTNRFCYIGNYYTIISSPKPQYGTIELFYSDINLILDWFEKVVWSVHHLMNEEGSLFSGFCSRFSLHCEQEQFERVLKAIPKSFINLYQTALPTSQMDHENFHQFCLMVATSKQRFPTKSPLLF